MTSSYLQDGGPMHASLLPAHQRLPVAPKPSQKVAHEILGAACADALGAAQVTVQVDRIEYNLLRQIATLARRERDGDIFGAPLALSHLLDLYERHITGR